MYAFLILLHILICAALIITVLLQSSKGEGLAGAFGGSGITGAVFGGRGAATFLSKATTILALAFFISSIALTFITPLTSTKVTGGGKSAVTQEAQKERSQGSVPATSIPVTTPAQTQTQPEQEKKVELPPPPPPGEKK
ncbi:MAG: preprotein translocase subunit SecG [candidate division Zixibacteria bacterium]|nr:preprotein translocase subunit SecG [candidate division Zixibacteria bacterium]